MSESDTAYVVEFTGIETSDTHQLEFESLQDAADTYSYLKTDELIGDVSIDTQPLTTTEL